MQNELADISTVEHRTRGLEGRQMIMILAPETAKKEKERKQQAAS